jgi:hypothetical protein
MSARDAIVLGAVILAFVALVTAHVWIVVGLALRPPRWRALVALIVAPLAPWWALREKMRVRGVVWIAGAALYVIARALART